LNILENYIHQTMTLHLAGRIKIDGILIEVGSDIIVLYNGEEYMYIPTTHVLHIKKSVESEIILPTDEIDSLKEISLRKILVNAKGLFTEIFVTPSQSIHGYITNVLSDYFVFYSPVYKTMFIPFHHLKWLTPYQNNQIPYGLEREMLPVHPSNMNLSRTFEIQLQKLIGKIIIIDLGIEAYQIGQLVAIHKSFIEIITARQETVFIPMNHIKTVHFQ
jgi:hypothetical protein